MDYTLKRSTRAKYLRITVQPGGAVIVTAPVTSRDSTITRFFEKSLPWVERAVRKMSRYKTLPVSGRRAYVKHKEAARTFITERVEYWNQFYGFTHGRIAIKDTRRCWGSCSSKGNLNFSYTLLFLPPHLADYVVVHELCHLKEHNHSRRFWDLVEQTVPEYRSHRRELQTYMTG